MSSSLFMLMPEVKRASTSTTSGLTAALWVSVAGIVVSGVIGPQLTSLATRRANRSQFNRDTNAKKKDELRTLLDEAAILLASGATNIRLIRERSLAGQAHPEQVEDWLGKVFPMGQRLRLRLPESNAVVKAYDRVREALVEASAGTESTEDKIVDFETKRTEFLNVARQELDKNIPEKR